MAASDADQIGSWAWAQETRGTLTSRQKLGFLVPALQQSASFLVGRLRLVLGLRSSDQPGFDASTLTIPDSKLAKEAEAAAVDSLTPAMVGHSYRTFVYGLALADVDQIAVDPEQLFTAAMMHDITLEAPSPEACFTVRGGEHTRQLAETAGADAETARALAEAVIHHITPGIGLELGPLPLLIQAGAMLDLTGHRLWDLSAGFVEDTISRYPRHDAKTWVSQCWRSEANTFPDGRAAFLESVFLFSLLIRLSPYKDG